MTGGSGPLRRGHGVLQRADGNTDQPIPERDYRGSAMDDDADEEVVAQPIAATSDHVRRRCVALFCVGLDRLSLL